jgi:hypothetical protein
MSESKRGIAVAAWSAIAFATVAAIVVVPGWVAGLRATHGAVASYVALISAGNAGDLEGVRRQCSERYVTTHRIEAAREGGVVGLPRNIHKNFQAWRSGDGVWLCPTNRVGPVYRFVREGVAWKFDGPAGVLRPGGQVLAGEDVGDSSP